MTPAFTAVSPTPFPNVGCNAFYSQIWTRDKSINPVIKYVFSASPKLDIRNQIEIILDDVPFFAAIISSVNETGKKKGKGKGKGKFEAPNLW